MKAIREVLPSRKKEKNTADNGRRLYRSIYTVLFMEYVIVPGRKGTVMKRIITFDKKVRLIIFNLPDFSTYI